MRKLTIVVLSLGILLGGCWGEGIKLSTGEWSFLMNLGEEALPFRAEFTTDSLNMPVLTIINGEERIVAEEIGWKEDSMFIQLPYFNAELHAHFVSETELEGVWHDYSRGPDYTIPFVATARKAGCPEGKEGTPDLSGTWQASFGEGDDTWPAVGKFRQEGSTLYGTFLTETGDYRYLEGCVNGKAMRLGTFDGAHAFLFTGTILEDGSLTGKFYSGNHYQTVWKAVRGDGASLRAADELTYLKEGYDRFTFRFPSLEGDTVSLEDPRFQNKAVIVQIMGSWCPNCLDESRLFAEWHKRYRDQGLEVVALAFERTEDREEAAQAINRFRDDLGAEYPFLYAGKASKAAAAEALPMLNHIMSYPTSIFIDREGNIRKIHTGFNGPGTGSHYADFVKEYEGLIQEMLQ